ncbi:MAG: hypothetical protein J2P46_05205 [Zavarzinella sp.]|nr:hypothetical protein [Zavarzinella sp.]
MKLPNAENAVVDIAKLRDYCLSDEHPRGKHKARVFAAALGLTADHAGELQAALWQAATTEEATATNADEHGQRYVLDFTMERAAGSARVRSSWIV